MAHAYLGLIDGNRMNFGLLIASFFGALAEVSSGV
jgi:hypothetical protein